MSSEVHDVAVTQVVAWPTLTLPSFVHAYVTVENQGTSYETFNVTIHADNLTATSATVADLAPGSNKTLERTCGLFPFREMIFPAPWSLDKPMIANVTIWVEASVVSGEVDTADNTCIDGTVHIIWGVLDVDGDGRISILDVVTIAKAFGRRNYGFHPCWDFNQDGIINILDLFYLAESFGRVDFELSSLHSGALQIRAWYATGSETGGWVGSFVVVEVSVSVPQSLSGTTTSARYNPLTLDLTPGTYTVSGTYDGVVKSVDVTVAQGETATALLNFGGPVAPWGPAPPA